MILAQILKRSVADDEPVLKEFLETMAEPFIAAHSLTAAKGSTHHYFGKNPDQSMVAHIFNGLFPAMRLLALAQHSRPRPYLSDRAQRLYVLGYLMHDLNKIRGLMEEVGTANQAQVQLALTMLREELERLNVQAFFPDYALYLQDILYLVVNTQLESGANHSVYQFRDLRHDDEREIGRARDLCKFSDCLAFLVKTPSDVLHGEGRTTFERVVREISGSRFSLVYHQFSDVRGLLTNTVNNGVKSWLAAEPTEGEIGSFVPYLYFPNGIVYLKTDQQAQPDLSTPALWGAIREKLGEECIDSINENTPGFKFNALSNLKYPGYFEDLLTPLGFTDLLVKACLRTRANVTKSTFESLQSIEAAGKLPPNFNLDYYPLDDARIAIVGRFLLNFDKIILERIKQPDVRQELTLQIRTIFKLSDETAALAQQIPSSGGLDYRYFWLGAQFVAQHRTLDQEGEEPGSVAHFLNSFIAQTRPLFELALQESWQGTLLPQLAKYVEAHLSFGGFGHNFTPTPTLPDFQAELDNYVSAKRRQQARLPCTVCNSSYLVEGRKQNDTEVLFQPWVYKNRLPLYVSENAGGICAICLLEMMLRQLRQQDELKLTGKDFEEQQIKFCYLYPSYFFTTETAALVGQVVNSLKTLSIKELSRKLSDTLLEPVDYLGLDMFQSDESYEENVRRRGYYRMDYDEKDTQGLIFFGLKALSREPTATETWAIPAMLGLMLPLVLGCKAVISDNYMPLFASGEDFKETVVLDAPHHFLSYLLTSDPDVTEGMNERQLERERDKLRITPAGRVRIDKVLEKLRLLSRVYFINYDTYGEEKGEPKWSMLNRVARGVRSDPLNIFRFLAMQARAKDAKSLVEGYWPMQTRRYMQAYTDIWNGLKQVTVGDDPMEIISNMVERYTTFYRPTFRSASIVRPVDIAAKVLFANPQERVQHETEYAQDVKLVMQGELMRWLDRVRGSEGAGRAAFYGKEISEKEAPAIQAFTDFFYDDVYRAYCRGQAGLLRSRLNNIKSGCEAYYSLNWRKWSKNPPETSDPNTDANAALPNV